jgi:predicted transcriptional regulator
MSDVLRFSMDETVLITGLCNNQTMRTAEMADLRVVLIGRDKQPDDEMLELAEDSDITIIKSKYSIFKLSGILYNAGIKPLY